MMDPIAAMRFLPLYRLGLHYCAVCRGPMNYEYVIDSGHYACASVSLKALCDAAGAAAEAIGALAEPMKALMAGVWAFKRSGNIAFRRHEWPR